MILDVTNKIKTLLWQDKIFREIKFQVFLIQSAILNPAKSPRKISQSSDSKNVLELFENHKLELFPLHFLRTNLLV